MITTKPFSLDALADLEDLFAQDASANKCWCRWFIDSVKEFHASGSEGNRTWFEEFAKASPTPLGVLAYRDGRAVGWCAVGPKERFARAVKTPTLRGVSVSSKKCWLVPCFFVRPEARRSGVTKALLSGAIELAQAHGAEAVEGFPVTGPHPASSGDRQVGTEAVFSLHGFEPVHRPSAKRVVMRRILRPPDAGSTSPDRQPPDGCSGGAHPDGTS